MTYQIILALFAFGGVASITPGPNNLMLMASGANFGFRRTIPHMLGVGLGFIFMLFLVGIGLVRVFEAFPQSFTILKIVSTLYLLFFAWKIANAKPLQSASDENALGSAPLTFMQASLFQWVNPKAWTMGTTAMAAYSVQDAPFLSVLVICAVFGIVSLPSISIWTIAGTKIRQFLNSPLKTRVFNITAAVLLVLSLYPAWFGH
ncbi:LysE family translocator [Hirschia baltica]|uniref:Lysine exporter protein (LYSE/YGGA) n=1 Tax=Hirschia baltica (strain ATCC 49814 / DSM 5838 / IFAM 1418) TaxID=582402 RepID=C6XRR0_HIRBI|nr:LysE family translocator [Hirschia baltica]ACT60670.1 Lysine exporter protein (LYSE/YGGA) [Hirschia baltica ATCC 49814]